MQCPYYLVGAKNLLHRVGLDEKSECGKHAERFIKHQCTKDEAAYLGSIRSDIGIGFLQTAADTAEYQKYKSGDSKSVMKHSNL